MKKHAALTSLALLSILAVNSSALAQSKKVRQENIVVGQEKTFYDAQGHKVSVRATTTPAIKALALNDEDLWNKGSRTGVGSCFIVQDQHDSNTIYIQKVTRNDLPNSTNFFMYASIGTAISTYDRIKITSKLRSLIQAGKCN